MELINNFNLSQLRNEIFENWIRTTFLTSLLIVKFFENEICINYCKAVKVTLFNLE